MRRRESAVILQTADGFVRVTNDKNTKLYRMGFKSEAGFEWKFISKELYDMLVKELSEQTGHSS